MKPNGFVVLFGQSTVGGIDVSKYEDEADFRKAYACGARFAYVRLSGGTDPLNEDMYRFHWPAARSAGLLTGPYHNLSFLPNAAQKFKTMPAANQASYASGLLAVAKSSAQSQAGFFLSNLDEVLSLQPLPDQFTAKARPSYLPIALDISTDVLADQPGDVKKRYAPVYSTMVCAFIDTVRKNRKTHNAKIVIFSPPEVILDYDLASAGCGLNKLSLWVRHYSANGGASGIITPAETDADNKTAQVCDKSKAFTCTMQQYTDAGGFAAHQSSASLDLDRFFGTEDSLRRSIQSY